MQMPLIGSGRVTCEHQVLSSIPEYKLRRQKFKETASRKLVTSKHSITWKFYALGVSCFAQIKTTEFHYNWVAFLPANGIYSRIILQWHSWSD